MSKRKRLPRTKRVFIADYQYRNAIIRQLGFRSYSEYLKSALWLAIRDGVLRLNRECYVCGLDATQVHHEKYTKENLSGEVTEYLVAICATCHYRLEFRDRDKDKLNPRQASQKMYQMRRKFDCARPVENKTALSGQRKLVEYQNKLASGKIRKPLKESVMTKRYRQAVEYAQELRSDNANASGCHDSRTTGSDQAATPGAGSPGCPASGAEATRDSQAGR